MAAPVAGAALDEDLEPGGLELGEHLGYQGDAPFTGRSLLGDTDLHGHHLTSSDDGAASAGGSRATLAVEPQG